MTAQRNWPSFPVLEKDMLTKGRHSGNCSKTSCNDLIQTNAYLILILVRHRFEKRLTTFDGGALGVNLYPLKTST